MIFNFKSLWRITNKPKINVYISEEEYFNIFIDFWEQKADTFKSKHTNELIKMFINHL